MYGYGTRPTYSEHVHSASRKKKLIQINKLFNLNASDIRRMEILLNGKAMKFHLPFKWFVICFLNRRISLYLLRIVWRGTHVQLPVHSRSFSTRLYVSTTTHSIIVLSMPCEYK